MYVFFEIVKLRKFGVCVYGVIVGSNCSNIALNRRLLYSLTSLMCIFMISAALIGADLRNCCNDCIYKYGKFYCRLLQQASRRRHFHSPCCVLWLSAVSRRARFVLPLKHHVVGNSTPAEGTEALHLGEFGHFFQRSCVLLSSRASMRNLDTVWRRRRRTPARNMHVYLPAGTDRTSGTCQVSHAARLVDY